MSIDLDALEATARSATPGPWERRVYDGVPQPKSKIVVVIEPENEFGYDRVTTLADYLTRANAEYIATFDPPTALALIARLREAEAVIEKVDSWNTHDIHEPKFWDLHRITGTYKTTNRDKDRQNGS